MARPSQASLPYPIHDENPMFPSSNLSGYARSLPAPIYPIIPKRQICVQDFQEAKMPGMLKRLNDNQAPSFLRSI